MYSTYNRSIPISFQNALYCGTESKQNNRNDVEELNEMTIENNSNFYAAVILLLLLEHISPPC